MEIMDAILLTFSAILIIFLTEKWIKAEKRIIELERKQKIR